MTYLSHVSTPQEQHDRPTEGLTPSYDEVVRLAADAAPVPMLITACEPKELRFANAAFLRLWGRAPFRSHDEVVEAMGNAAADPDLVRALWKQLEEEPGFTGTFTNLLLRSGRLYRWCITPLGDGGMPSARLHVFEEVHHNEERLRDRADLFRLAFEKAGVGMMLLSEEWRVLHANRSLCGLLGYPQAEITRLCFLDFLHPVEAEQHAGCADALETGDETQHRDLRLLHRSGEPIWAHVSLSAVRDAAGRPVCYIAMAEDISERKRREADLVRRAQELATLATVDPKTGLFNHRHMQDVLSRRLQEARRSGRPFSLLMLDVDHFRRFNEVHGHDAGDRVLKGVADALRTCLREHDVACRYGGEEFVLLLVDTCPETAEAAAERVRRCVEASGPIAPGAETVTCSLGVATYPYHASTGPSLLKAADIALYEAKRAGRNRVARYSVEASKGPSQHLERLESDLQGASAESIDALVTAIDLRDRYTGAHCQRVARLSADLARHLGLSEPEADLLRMAGSLVDVGKIGLPDAMLTRPDQLTREEWELMRQHPVWGERLLRSSSLPSEVLQLVRWHHERLDGSGYPDQLSGEAIPFLARIIHVADIATALRDHRPHRPAWTREQVVEHLRTLTDTQLDGRVVQAYCEMYAAP